MKDIFAEVNKQMEENKERWVEIDKVVAELKATPDTAKLTQLVLLLVDQLRPLQQTMGQAEDMQKEINDMLGSIAKMARK